MTRIDHAVPVRHRWTVLTCTRLALAGAAAVAVAAIPDLAGDRADAVLAACGLYAAFVALAELLRHLRNARAVWLMAFLVVLDCVFLASVVNATGGTPSPLNTLVYLHIVAITLVVSFRVGLQAAVLHAALVMIPAMAAGAALVDSPMWSGPSGSALRATSYLLLAIATAAYASVDERALRRSQARLVGQVDLLSDLDQTTTVDEASVVIGRHVVGSLGFTRAAVVVIDGDQARIVVTEGQGDRLDHVIAAPSDGGGVLDGDCLEEGRPLLLGGLDPERWPVLADLLPGARDVVVVRLAADDSHRGAIVAEWTAGRRHDIALDVVDELMLTARYGGMALRSAFLLAEVEDRSRRDLLTGLGNRRWFEEALEREVSRTQRIEAELSVILLDLDRFKAVNDQRGHLAGDAVLEAVGHALSDAARAHDVVARIGGDEFAILLTDCGLDAARIVAERARRTVWAAVGDQGVSACAGVATAPVDGCRPKELVRQADQALYQAKASGRNCVVTAPAPGPAAHLVDLSDGRMVSLPENTAEIA